MKRLVMDVDMTLTKGKGNLGYEDAVVNRDVVDQLVKYKAMGFTIVLNSSRNINTFDGNIGKINKYTLPVLIEWLKKNNIPYDEIYIGKPWCGFDGFYVDDKAIRPSEFISLSYEEILQLLGNEK
ncbi:MULTISPECIES: capsular biosynthesis protein [unclassified Gilliamella]|uniref:capsular biosynthesis protein n=1 Tax=unclassified Gilliamella TaxID=2685620 RepID=UPI001320C430|nr:MULTISPECIES: capsular biosynthesis protein [unclassified Gilliamella]MWN31259.1 capsular biosynthesis protein [Gilliamella sp. Pra-s60]MWP29898.1 capsular biosynthesis protein [Gilliamella sp. Pra-s54]